MEAKWKGSSVGLTEGRTFIDSLEDKAFPLPNESWSKKGFFVLSGGATTDCRKVADESNVVIIELEDLFSVQS